MFGLNPMSKNRRLFLGIGLLLLVDIIWVASSELSEHVFSKEHYEKPYFCTYLRTSMFILYLSGFLCCKAWWKQCKKRRLLQSNGGRIDTDSLLSEPIFVPVKFDAAAAAINDLLEGGSSDSDESSTHTRSVRFSNLSEVRQLSDAVSEDAKLARLSWSAYMRAEELKLKTASRLTVKQVIKAAILFCCIYFFAKLSYREALKFSQKDVVDCLSSTSGLFTLILAAIFPSSSGDRFTLSKFVAVLLSMGGVVMLTLSTHVQEAEVPVGAMWALSGALLYAIYLVMMRRRAENEDKLNMPMFFGFLGFVSLVVLWPGFFVFHFSQMEHFEWPSPMQWSYLVVNGLIGTVISELLWLWGCFLTTSLTATLALSLTIPMSMIFDIAINNVRYNWMFYVGVAPVFLAFFAVSFLSHYDNWDPVLLAFRKISQCVLRKRLIPRLRELDREQTESLIGACGDRSLSS